MKGDREIHHNRKALWSLFTLPAIILAVACFAFSAPAHATQTVPYKINFQGRLTNASGTTLSGTYDMQFKLYTAVTSGTYVWGETRTAANGNAMTVTNGLFNLLIGEGTAVAGSSASLQAAIAANTNLFIEVTVGAEVMTPRSQFGSSAYAINSDMIDGIDGASLAQLSTANAFTNTNSITTSNASAFVVNSGSSNLFKVDTTGTGQVVLGTADANGTVLVLDTKNDNSTDPTGANGAMYYNSTAGRFRCYQASAWADCISGAGASGTFQNVYDNSSSPATITTTAAKGVKIAAGAVPTADLFTVDNTGQAVTAAGINGVAVKYVGGAAAVEGAGIRVDSTPGTTSGGVWSGLRIVAAATGPVTGVTAYGIKLEGPTAQGAGTETATYVGTGWDIGIDIQSGGMQLAAQSDPASPAAGNLRIYAKDIAGRIMPKWTGPAGVDTPFQASLGFNRVSLMMPMGGTTLTTFVGGLGTTFTNTGTAANPTPTSTNLLTSVRRATFSSGATAGTVASHRQSVLQVWRGNAAGLGGFFYTIRFGTSTLASGNRAFVGLSDSVAAPTNIDPTTTGTGIGRIGMAINASTGNWNFVNNISGTAPTVAALGANFPVSTTALYELILYSPPNGSAISYRVQNLSTGNQTSGSVSTNIPAATTFLAPQFWITNNATAAAAIIDFSGWYLESDN
ncbi:MAG: hypothetical protein ABIP74_00795 [Candidatus Saccharimonas sp.]